LFLLSLAIASLVLHTGFASVLAWWYRTMPRLRAFTTEGIAWPTVSVVIAARNEARNIGTALQSVLALDYPSLEILIVNDRSTDRTGAIIDEISRHDSRVHRIEIDELPPGWLGKTHALHEGARNAAGELLLFTDADVVFETAALKRAVRCLLALELDHLTLSFRVKAPSLVLRAFVATFSYFFVAWAQPWRARNPKSSGYVGVGAFNLVRAAMYRQAGGHARIAMCTDDDMKLGKLLKRQGARQALADSEGTIEVEWYSSVSEAIHGLEKNGFAGLDYSVIRLIGSTLALLAFHVWPFAAIALTDGLTRWLNLACVVILVLLTGRVSSGNGGRWTDGILFPLVTVLFLYMIWRSAAMAILRGGVRWRETFYPLKELRSNRF
jgi:glycosyltransferase involved in cell wall biosynthesis